MRKYFEKLLFLVLICTLASCSKANDAPNSTIWNVGDLVVFNTLEDFHNYLLEGIDENLTKITDSSEEDKRNKAGGVNILNLKGYTSMTSEGNKKGVFSKEVADKVGIAPGIYIIAREHYSKEFRLDNNQYIITGYRVDHSKCGYMPTSSKSTRGYSIEQNERDVTLSTLIVHVKSDISGNSVGLYSPLGYDISKLEWFVPYITTPGS